MTFAIISRCKIHGTHNNVNIDHNSAFQMPLTLELSFEGRNKFVKLTAKSSIEIWHRKSLPFIS
jgi:hypothetical protein